MVVIQPNIMLSVKQQQVQQQITRKEDILVGRNIANPSATEAIKRGIPYRTVSDIRGQYGEVYINGRWIEAWAWFRNLPKIKGESEPEQQKQQHILNILPQKQKQQYNIFSLKSNTKFKL